MKHQNSYAFSSAGNRFSSCSEDRLIQAVISRVAPKRDCRKISQSLLSQFGDIRSLLRAPCSEIMRKTKAPRRVAEELNRTHELLQALAHAEIAERPLLDDYDAVLEYCQIILAGEQREQFHALMLGKSFHLIAHECMQIGTVDHVSVYPRELMARALQHAACTLILIHNHPSGNVLPSTADREMTELLQEVGSFFGISVADHIIVSDTGRFSFREQGLISPRHNMPKDRDDASNAISPKLQS